MKTVSMSGSLRENVGKKDAKMNRRLGKVPCVLYGGKEHIHFTADERSFNKIVFTPNVYIIKLNIDGKEYNAVLQDIQYHPVTDKILHVDFLEILDGKAITIAIPVKLKGSSIGIIQGGRLIFKLKKMKVKALVEHLPDDIVIDISDLKIGDSVRVSDVKRDNLEFLDSPTAIVVGVRVTRVVEEVEEEEEEEEVAEGEEGEAPAESEGKEDKADQAKSE